MQRLDEIASKQRLRAAIFELEGLSQPSMLSVAAIFVLKNELGGDGSGPREIRVSRRFSIPGSLRERLASGIRRLRREGGAKGVAGLFRDLGAWWRGEDRERFRDRCDRYFWERMVPVIGRDFGDLAGPLANTINEVIINYAEYSFPPRAFGRRVTAQIFLTTARAEPAALTVVRRPGMAPRWGVSWTELVDQAAASAQAETIAWYRLACSLPPALPEGTNVASDPADRARAAEDYGLVVEQLGPCTRNTTRNPR